MRVHSGSGGSAKKVLVPVADGSEDIETATIIDTLVRGGAKVTVAGVGNDLTVTCSRGMKIVVDCFISDCTAGSWDMIVCPGGMPGAQHLSESESLVNILKKQNNDRKYLAAICAAPAVVLAHHGLLDGKDATCYPVSKFTGKIDRYISQHVVQDGHVITSQGPATAMSFALKLVEILFGAEKAQQIKEEMLA